MIANLIKICIAIGIVGVFTYTNKNRYKTKEDKRISLFVIICGIAIAVIYYI